MFHEAQKTGMLTSMLLRTAPALCGVSVERDLSAIVLDLSFVECVTICRPKVVLSELHEWRFGDLLGARAHKLVHDAWGRSLPTHSLAFVLFVCGSAHWSKRTDGPCGGYWIDCCVQPGIHPVQLSPMGRATVDFQSFVDRLPDRGEPYTPIAILLSYGHGTERSSFSCKMLDVFPEDIFGKVVCIVHLVLLLTHNLACMIRVYRY